jgi:hypothetical protein
MAKQLIRSYVFTPTANTIEIQGRYDLGQLLVITNVTRNVILYNFADSTFAGTTITFNRSNSTNFPKALQTSDGTTLIGLQGTLTGMTSSDNIQIFVEKNEVITRPWALGTDAFERQRVAAPQSMLDADFEYGLQPTKWQTIDMNRGTPSIYEVPGTDLVVNAMYTDASGGGVRNDVSSLITVVTLNPHQLTTGTVISVQNLDNTVSGYARASGKFPVNSATATNIFTYYAKGQVSQTTGTNLLTTYTVIRKGGYYTNAGQTPTYSVVNSGISTTGTVTLTFPTPHGYLPGAGLISSVSSDNGSNNHLLTQGDYYVASVPTLQTLTFNARNTGTISGTISGTVYARSDAFYQHRPFDGGVTLGAGGPNYGSMAVRMSKKYIRYQSGKAVNYNTAALFAPNYDVRIVTATNTVIGSTIYITTDDIDHGLQSGATVILSNVQSTGYSGTYTVATVIDERTIAVTSTNTLTVTTAVLGTPTLLHYQTWHGSTIRAGTFDDQNGMFWQYDGQYMAAVLRSSTFQTGGTVTVTPGSNFILGLNSRFDQQLIAGDRVVIKGMSHVVTNITSSTWMYVNPPYRGNSLISGVKMTKTIEQVAYQNQWNFDRCDGSNGPFNPSGYNLLPYKLQMIGLQWTWYGAGFIDWMLRGSDGNYMTVHRMKNSNVNNEAYMRSGNQPVRYEVQNEGARSYLTTALGSGDTSMTIADVTTFPPRGTVYIDNELITYTAKTTSTNQLIGLARSSSIGYFQAGAYRTYTAGSAGAHASGTGVILASTQGTPPISHWGSAFMTDGGFDNDRGYIFNYQATNVTISTRKTTAFAIRLAPSVSNAVTGDLGQRDLINRAQLLLQGIEITAGGTGGSTGTQAIVIEGVINPSNFPANPSNITWYSLQGTPQGGNQLGTGQPSFSQIAPSGGINFDNTSTITTQISNSFSPGTTQISVSSTASLAIGDVMVNVTRPTSTQGNSVVLAIGAGTVTLSLPLIGAVSSGDSVTFYRNLWAQPGETIFSFISNPSTKDSLDLSALKELTNTPVGGRGCYPNGPDVLMINVYLTAGTPVSANLVLRWGEAQA